MGGMQAATVLITVKQDQMQLEGKQMSEEEVEKMRKSIVDKYDYEGSAYYSTARLWDDGIIDPVDTRHVIAMGIAMSLNEKYAEKQDGVYRM